MANLEDRLARLLDAPKLARVVPRLPAETLHQLVRYRGVEASGELLAAATREQLASLLDVELWATPRAAGDEQFDPNRFGEWLEALVENGDALAARVVSALDERIVTAGLCAHVRVFDPAARARVPADDDATSGGWTPRGEFEACVGGYEIVARRADAWDAIVALLVSLESGHRDCFHAVMRRCRLLSNSAPEADGFHDLLSEPGQLLHDLSLARHSRRSERGYLSEADARMVLGAARQRAVEGQDALSPLRLAAAEYFRRADREAEDRLAARGGSPVADQADDAEEIDHSIQAVIELVDQVSAERPERPLGLLTGKTGEPSGVERLQALLQQLRAADVASWEARAGEVAFLANVLMAGCSFQARSFTPAEASDAALAACSLGLEECQEAAGLASLPGTFLAEHDFLSMFHRGWAALHQASMAAAARLVAVLDEVRCVDVETQLGLHVLQRQLAKHREAGAPWRARDALDVVATLDMLAWVSLLGVLDECPILPAALRATLERRTGAVSATDFEFISTRAQIADVRAFMARLPDILVR